MRGLNEHERTLRDNMARCHDTMKTIMDKVESGAKLTDGERRDFEAANDEFKMHQKMLATLSRGNSAPELPAISGPFPQRANVPEIQGEPKELLQRGQSMSEWVRRAAENGVTMDRFGVRSGKSTGQPVKLEYQDNDYLNAYWGQRLGISSGNSPVLTRALGEDTSGSGQAITPQSWTASFVDFLYAQTVLGRAGISKFGMTTELVNVPIFSAPVQPAWIAENSTVGIDANAAFGTLQFNSTGGFKDITLYSIEQAQDAYIQGGLPGMLAESAARNYALAIDVAGLQGIAGNGGNPGLVNETGFVSRQYTSDGGSGIAPADTTEFSKVNEIIANKHIDLSIPEYSGAILSNPSVYGTINRTNASTYAKFWDMPKDVADLPWYRTANINVMPTTEADGGALTGGALSSFYMGPWSFMVIGTHMDLHTQILTERYVDYAQVGLFTMMRFSIRTGHPETFVRTRGLITT